MLNYPKKCDLHRKDEGKGLPINFRNYSSPSVFVRDYFKA